MRVILIFLIIMGFLNSILYPETISIICSIFMLFIISTKRINEHPNYYSFKLIQGSIVMIIYDLLFLVAHTKSTQIQGLYVMLLVILNFIGFISKLGLLISSVIIKVKLNRAASNSAASYPQ